MKKLLICLTLGAIVIFGALRAQAASSANMTIKWNNNYAVTVAFQGNYSATGTSGSLSPSSTSFIPILNGGSGQCNGGGSSTSVSVGGAGTTALTMDFGNVKPDSTVSTVCVLLNAVEASVHTADPAGANLLVQMTGTPSTPASLCYIPIANNAPKAIGSSVASSQLAAAKAQDTTDTTSSLWTDPTQNCSGLKYNGAAVAGATAFSTTQTNFLASSDSTTDPAYFGADYALIVPASASAGSGSDAMTITYTVTSN